MAEIGDGVPREGKITRDECHGGTHERHPGILSRARAQLSTSPERAPRVGRVYSTVIAAVAGEPLILEALSSVMGQTLPPRSVHVVIDHEADAGRDWVTRMQAMCPGVQVHVQPGTGMASAVAFGISRVDTAYVSFLDCDDLWLPRKQELQIDVLRRSSATDAVTCLAQNVDPRRGLSGRPRRSTMFTATTFRTDAFSRYGMPDPAASHYVWLYRWWAAATLAGISTDTIEYLGLHRRIHGGNSWITRREQAHRDLMAELRRLSAAKRGAPS